MINEYKLTKQQVSNLAEFSISFSKSRNFGIFK